MGVAKEAPGGMASEGEVAMPKEDKRKAGLRAVRKSKPKKKALCGNRRPSNDGLPY